MMAALEKLTGGLDLRSEASYKNTFLSMFFLLLQPIGIVSAALMNKKFE